MIDQMYSQKLYDRMGDWERAYTIWAFVQPNGLVDPVEWIRTNGLPSSSPELTAAYAEMQRANLTKESALRAQYNTINPCPVQRYRGRS